MFFIWKSVNLGTIKETVNKKNATPAKAHQVHTIFKGLELNFYSVCSTEIQEIQECHVSVCFLKV